MAIENAGQGTDTVQSSVSYALAAGIETLILSGSAAINATGNIEANVITGNGASNNLNGGMGNDTLIGRSGKDLLTGSGGFDRMVYEKLADSGTAFASRDVINTFAHGDKIDLSAIDANNRIAGNQAFTFVTNFTGAAGQLQWDLTGISATGVKGYLVQGDVNGDRVADFSLQIYTSPTNHLPGGSAAWNLAGWDFIL